MRGVFESFNLRAWTGLDSRCRSAIPQLFAAGFLTLAAVGKLILVLDGAEFDSFVIIRSFGFMFPIGELALAFFLAYGRHKSATVLGALAFLAFSLISFTAYIRSDDHCGCFGVYRASPLFIAVLDTCVAIALARTRPTPISGSGSLFFCSLFALGALAGAPSPTYTRARDVKNWIGLRLPIMHCISNPSKLQENRWTILLYSSDCPSCENLVRRFEESAEEGRGSKMQFLAVDFADDRKTRMYSRMLQFENASDCLGTFELPAIVVIDSNFVLTALSPIDFDILDERLTDYAIE